MAKADKAKANTSGNRSPFGSDELAAPHVGDDKHEGDLDHGHAGYQSQRDADIRLQRAQGNSRAATPQDWHPPSGEGFPG